MVIFGVFAVLVGPGELVRIGCEPTGWAIGKNLAKLAISAYLSTSQIDIYLQTFAKE